ncbi:hypothetical protein BH20ACT10_BH20ACT10_13950 [soil metagenome]
MPSKITTEKAAMAMKRSRPAPSLRCFWLRLVFLRRSFLFCGLLFRPNDTLSHAPENFPAALPATHRGSAFPSAPILHVERSMGIIPEARDLACPYRSKCPAFSWRRRAGKEPARQRSDERTMPNPVDIRVWSKKSASLRTRDLTLGDATGPIAGNAVVIIRTRHCFPGDRIRLSRPRSERNAERRNFSGAAVPHPNAECDANTAPGVFERPCRSTPGHRPTAIPLRARSTGGDLRSPRKAAKKPPAKKLTADKCGEANRSISRARPPRVARLRSGSPPPGCPLCEGRSTSLRRSCRRPIRWLRRGPSSFLRAR